MELHLGATQAQEMLISWKSLLFHVSVGGISICSPIRTPRIFIYETFGARSIRIHQREHFLARQQCIAAPPERAGQIHGQGGIRTLGGAIVAAPGGARGSSGQVGRRFETSELQRTQSYIFAGDCDSCPAQNIGSHIFLGGPAPPRRQPPDKRIIGNIYKILYFPYAFPMCLSGIQLESYGF